MDRNRDLLVGGGGTNSAGWEGNWGRFIEPSAEAAGRRIELSDGSIEGLISRLDALGYRVRISIEPKVKKQTKTLYDAQVWLELVLFDGGIPSELLFEMAKLEGFSKPMVYEAGGKINAQKRPSVRNGVKCWIWEIKR